MPRFHIEIDVECKTIEQAEQVAAERLGPDEDYGFEYRWASEPLVTPNDHAPNPELDSCLQVFMVHDSVIKGFKAWLASHDLELQQIPRFDVPDHYYTRTHSIVPKNLSELLKGQRP
ncbi:hypothetical protein SEA_BRUHMOMENT_103 [Arthrobacter phage BruhMoment]|nr:hypothetical protein SEA_BRUHMOMENT_103 [Arthrobacter phage BruhMoment]